MYFEGKIMINPEGVSQIEKIKPTKVFNKMLYFLTMGGVSKKQEIETFTALSVLQQINMVLIKNNIDNILRLSHDEFDFYLDNEGKQHDLKDAIDQYDIELNEAMSIHFNKLVLVLETEDDSFKYLIEVAINRTHEVGEYPIDINITGLLKEFRQKNDVRQLKSKIKKVVASQKAFDNYKKTKLVAFEDFVDTLKLSIKSLMKIDAVESEIKTKIVIPEEKVSSTKDIKHRQDSRYYGVHYGYYGFDHYMLYSMFWADSCHNQGVTFYDTHFESSSGIDMGYHEEAEASAELFDGDVSHSPTDTYQSVADTTETSSSSWFGEFFDSSSNSDSSSSCSSCGGGGGGCGGD